jgi:hypothetical protein
MEVAHEQAEARAKELGIPVNRILGGHKSPFVGEPFVPDVSDQFVQQDLNMKLAEASVKGKQTQAQRLLHDLKDHQSVLSKKAAKHKREFKPDKSRADLKKEIARARSDRKGLGV